MKILILCTGNSCRSQMAEAILQSFDPGLKVFSAGTKPSANIHPQAISVMKELGIDLSDKYPKNVKDFMHETFDYVITVCAAAKESCPVFAGKVAHRLHIGFDDPAEMTGTEEEVIRGFRRVRDEILREFYRFYHTDIQMEKG